MRLGVKVVGGVNTPTTTRGYCRWMVCANSRAPDSCGQIRVISRLSAAAFREASGIDRRPSLGK